MGEALNTCLESSEILELQTWRGGLSNVVAMVCNRFRAARMGDSLAYENLLDSLCRNNKINLFQTHRERIETMQKTVSSLDQL
mmetsp:Transcript_28592/g.69713  ORF Transcript_28592/g.69713 Transcript_28592/m.69713 type:complete len:83 (-) Transcript_28592:211-459(-)